MKRFFAQAYLWLLLAMLYAPILIIAVFSFTEAKVLGNWTGFSTKLYTSLFSGGVHHYLLSAIENTLIIAFVITGGIPSGTGFGTGAVFVLVEMGVGFVFWIGNFIYFFREARKIKAKLKEHEDQQMNCK